MAFYENTKIVASLRAVQLILSIIILGLTAYVANWWHNYWHAIAPSQINFMVFCAVWSLLALLYLSLVPRLLSNSVANHRFGLLGAEVITMLFWFAGFIALAVFLSDRVCFGHVCSAAKAACVFGAFVWLAFAITTAMAVMTFPGGRRTHTTTTSDAKVDMSDGV